MAEKQAAEDDDDEGFGDFTFAPSYSFPNHVVHSNQINGSDFFKNNDDDEWGDFVNHSSSPITHQSELSNGLFRTQSPPGNVSQFSKPIDPFGFFSDHLAEQSPSASSPVESESRVCRVEVEKNEWVKPKGALPLSMFGDVEEEDGSGVGGGSVVDGTDVFARERVDSARNGSSLNVGMGIDDIIANLYNQSEQIKVGNGSNSNSNGLDSNRLGSIANLFDQNDQVKQIKVGNGLNSNSNGLDSNTLNSIANLFDQNDQVKVESGSNSNWNSNGSNLNLNGLNSIVNLFDRSEQMKAENGLNSNATGLDSNEVEGNDDDDDGWEFKVAVLESEPGGENFKEERDSGLLGFKATAINQEIQVDGKGQKISEGGEYSSGFGNGAHGSSDLFATSNGFSYKSSKLEIGFDFEPTTVVQNGFISNAYSETKQNEGGNELNSYPVNGNVDSDENFWEYKDAFSETELRHKEEAKVAELSPAGVYVPTLDGEIQVNKIRSDNHGGALPLSLFSDGKLEPDDILNHQDVFTYKPSTYPKNGLNSHGSSMSVDDLILNLYSQAEGVPPVDSTQKPTVNGYVSTQSVLDSNLVNDDDDFDDNSWEFKDAFLDARAKDQTSEGVPPVDLTQKPTENGLVSTQSVPDSNLVNDEDDFDDNSWEFKDAFLDARAKDQTSEGVPPVDSTQKTIVNGLISTQTVLDSNLVNDDNDFDDSSWEFKDAVLDAKAKDRTSVLSHGDTHQNVSTKLKVENYVDFYSKLKDESCLIALCHLDSLKKAKSFAALPGEDAKVVALDEEIQEAHKELCQENLVSEEVYPENHPPRIRCINEILEVLHEPKFQVLESEYHLSGRLSLAEKDLRSAIELLKHATSILKILTLASTEEQSSYVSTWSKMISVCAQEMKHGASIWKQLLQENDHSQILFEPRGQQFIIALGEIYRVVEILGASAKLYKPWILSSVADPKTIFALLEECCTLWSSSGFEEALLSISDPTGFEYDGTIKTLLESIKHIHDLDMHFQNHSLAQQEPICRLSFLTPAMLPDMKMVVWDGEHYFLKLANLWANLISCHPPMLPHIKVG
ncbi:hypothetical protein L1049_021266 [Liquidambar formosana]|uniref:Synergin gamma C-terminal domain-containing protein n=1 Tax=Liquidambar formosana TaxID=63359 RepID=A0AAP0X4X6_LIQFO